ncbi:hypothetical protein MAR_019959 [Mya arenaria]|uniref:DUF4371 domain-containing protein n=1 Tax=Mya arenaria TaxID=6604 RepID=A0ABY7E439_MYAAR|nr:hypothetical protein MAR_019959 [Mya arenaria]
MLDELRQVSCCGIIVDESCNISVEMKLGIYVRHMNITSGDTVNKFMGNVAVRDGKACTLTQEIVNAVKGFVLCVADLVSLGSDGASVMMGRHNVISEPSIKLKELINIRWLSMHDAIDTIRRSYQSIVNFLEDEADGKNDTKPRTC